MPRNERAGDERARDVARGRLKAEDYAANFADIHPNLTAHQALVEADRCYFCHDAPCTEACPTDIDIPMFIRQIATWECRICRRLQRYAGAARRADETRRENRQAEEQGPEDAE